MSHQESQLEDLVYDALEKAIQHAGEQRLLSKGAGKSGLIPGGRVTKQKKSAIEQCLNTAIGLFTVREAPEGQGKSATTVHYVTITERGIQALLAKRTWDQRKELLERCASTYRELARRALLSTIEKDLQQLQVERQRLDQRASEVRDLLSRVINEELSDITRQRQKLDQHLAELQRMQNDVESIAVAESDGMQTASGAGEFDEQSRQDQSTEAISELHRDLCRELVFSWQDNPEPEIRAALERVMINAGLEPVGEPGDVVPFDAREHQTESDLLPGQPARVIEPGWQLTTPLGAVLLARAKVLAVESAEETCHATHAEH